MKIYGYARISKAKQNIERQIRNIRKAFPSSILYHEAFTGTKTESRKEWVKLRKIVVKGDTIVFDSVSRMSRNAEEGFADYESLFHAGVELVFLKEPHINTSVFRSALARQIEMTGTEVDYILEGVNRYMMEVARTQIRLAFEQSEKEVLDLRQRTKEGLETARLKGKQIGRKEGSTYETKRSAAAKTKMLKHCKTFGGSLNDTDCMELLGLSRNTYYKYKRELKAAHEAIYAAELIED